jgi:hypothetical protein
MAKHGTDLVLWVCLAALIIAIILFVLRLYLISELSVFEHDSRNPLDCCQDLNAILPYESAVQWMALVLSLLKWSRSTILLVVYAVMIAFSFYLRRIGKHRYEPMNFVRDLSGHQMRCFVPLVGSLVGIIAMIGNCILSVIR